MARTDQTPPLDDHSKPEFTSWRSYSNFAQRVGRKRRYVWECEVQLFLDTVLATLKDRDVRITKNTILSGRSLGSCTILRKMMMGRLLVRWSLVTTARG